MFSYKQLAPQRTNSAPSQVGTPHSSETLDIFCNITISQSSSVSVVSDYGLDNWVIEVQSLAKARGFVL
jgi:hypothetical protein